MDERGETMTGTGMGTGTGTGGRTGTGIRTRAGMEARTEAGTGMVIERSVERRESLGSFEVVIEVGRKTQEGERCQRVTSNHSRQTRQPSETVASCGGPESRDGTQGTILGKVQERRRVQETQKSYSRDVESGGDLGGKRKNVDKKVLVEYLSTQKIMILERKYIGKRKALRANVRIVEIFCPL